MGRSSASPSESAPPAGSRRVLLMLLGGVVALAAIFFVTKVAMPHSTPSNPIKAVTSAPGKARAAAAAADAATAKLNAQAGGAPISTTTTVIPGAGTVTPGAPSGDTGPAPNTTRNPFMP